jgi:hypothetical protein
VNNYLRQRPPGPHAFQFLVRAQKGLLREVVGIHRAPRE